EHHRQRPGRCGDRFEVDQRLAQGLPCVAHGAVVIQKILITGTPTTAMSTALASAVLLDDHAAVETHQWSDVGRHATIEPGYQHVLPDARQAYRYLLDSWIKRARCDVDALEQLDLFGPAEPVQRVVPVVQRRERGLLEHLHAYLLPGASDRTSCLRSLS